MKKYTLVAISIASSLISIYLGISAELVVVTWIWIIMEIRRLFKANKFFVAISALMLVTAMPHYLGWIIMLVFYMINIIIITHRYIKNKPFPQVITVLLTLITGIRQGGAIILIVYIWNIMEIKKHFAKNN